MLDFPFSERFIQRENYIEFILNLLYHRFPSSDLQPVIQALETIHELDRLKKLVRVAVNTPSLQVFLQKTDATES